MKLTKDEAIKIIKNFFDLVDDVYGTSYLRIRETETREVVIKYKSLFYQDKEQVEIE